MTLLKTIGHACLLAGLLPAALERRAVAADLDAYALLDAAIEAEAENASGLHRYVFYQDAVTERVRDSGRVSRRTSEKYSVAWIDGREIPELIDVNGKKPKKRDLERRQAEVDRLLARIAEERAGAERAGEDGPRREGVSIPGWHIFAGVAGREERQTFALTELDSDGYDLQAMEDGLGLVARPTAEALRRRAENAPAVFEHRLWLDPETHAWIRWEALAVHDGAVLGKGSRQTMTRILVEEDILIESAIDRTWLYRLMDRPDAPVSRVDARIRRYDFRRFFDVESAISYQDAILDR